MKTTEKKNVSSSEIGFDELEEVLEHSEEVFKDNVKKIMELVHDDVDTVVGLQIKIIMALHNFDLDNADSPYSMALKASFHYHMYPDTPWEFSERVEELLCMIKAVLGSYDSPNVDIVVRSALAVHKNRIVSKHFSKIGVEYFWTTLNGTTSIPSDNKQPD